MLGEEVDRDVRRLGVRGGIEAGGHRDMMARKGSASGAPGETQTYSPVQCPAFVFPPWS